MSITYGWRMDVWQVDQLRPEPKRPEILRSDDGAARVITMAITRGTVRVHDGHEHGWVMVLDGLLEITSGEQTVQLGRGTLAHFDPYEQRRVEAKMDTTVIYLLTPFPGANHPSTEKSRGERAARSAA